MTDIDSRSLIFIYKDSDCISCINKSKVILDKVVSINENIPIYEYNYSNDNNINHLKSITNYSVANISNANQLFYYLDTPLILVVSEKKLVEDAFFINTQTDTSMSFYIQSSIFNINNDL